ncbi:hypothetical protein HFD88_007606 [Aspergillus terreus]|nr:hypothetical protein HFD88_007606 [Aspergillus terreus]
MAEITVDKALSLLSSDKQKDRTDGLADLKHILQQNKRNSKLASLNDKACYKIFESLFRFFSTERSLYNRAHSKGASTARLSACASVIRTAVDVFLRNLRSRSVRAIIDHVTDFLMVPSDGLLDVLCVDYTKCLTSILHYPPHLEHLGTSEWKKILDSCLKIINVQNDEESSLLSSSERRSTLDGYLASDRGSTPSRMTPALPVRERSKGNQSAIGEAVTCIQLLTTSSNAPIQDHFDKVLRSLAKFLRPYHIPGATHQAAIRSINSVVMKVMFDQTEFIRMFLLDLIPTIQNLWTTKLAGLKDGLLVTLMLCLIILTDTVKREPSESLASILESLTDVIFSEYAKRPDKEILQIDEVTFYQTTSDHGERFSVWPRPESPKSEHSWTTIWIISNLMKLSEEIAARLAPPRVVVLASGTRKLCALQMIPFVSGQNVSVESKTSLLHRLIPNILDGNGMVSSWTMIAIASLAGSPGVDSQALKAPWRQIWDLASRASTSQITSRAACTLMNCLLQFDLLEYSEVAEVTTSMLSSVNLSGPSTLSDSSLALWAMTIRGIAQTNPGSVPNAVNQICAWLRQSWTIGTTTDRLQTAQVATFARPLDLLNTILATTNRPFEMPRSLLRGPTGLVAQGWLFYYSQVFLTQISPLLGPDLYSPEAKSVVKQALSQLAPPLARVLEIHRKSQQDTILAQDEEPMDLDDPLMSSDDRLAEAMCIINMNREASSLIRDFATFQRSVTIQLSVFERIHGSTHSPEDEPSTGSLVDYLTDLDAADLLPYLLRLLEDLGEKCLREYELERCENAHILCIHMMHSFVKSWAIGESDDLSDSASDIYTWFIDVLLAKGRASPAVLAAFVELLGGLISCNASYAVGESGPSPRTGLFMILKEGDISVKFDAGALIPKLFSQYPLTDHDAIFDDVLESLPRDLDWVEGIALRLFILAQLASQWHTLLRRSIYHMFETPAQAPGSLWYAKKCISRVSESLGLTDPKELFRLFSSQVLYTWMETQRITSVPFSIFGYESIEEMLIDVQDEIVGQIMMRARDDEGVKLSNHLGTPFVELLGQSFYKAEAYSIARDLSTPPGQGSQPKGVENRMKKALGTDRFLRLIDQQFPQAVSTFFGALDQHEQVERAFSKRPNFNAALSIMKCILGKSSSNIALPPNQQPSFRARFLLDELEFLCKRSGYELETIWTPALVSYVCRTLLESIHPALGSLHACAVIRKIRILVCVAGDAVLSDYPLEMMLNALHPFLTDPYCSEDALGIFWYLLEAGKAYLMETPGLMAEIAVSTLLSLGKFLAFAADETKTDSQSKSVSEKSREFLQWFEVYLETYESSTLSAEQQGLFRRLVASSNKRYATDQIDEDRTERDVLLEVLGDRISKNSLLTKPASNHIIKLLCTDSMLPDDWQLDVTGNDEYAISTTGDPVVGALSNLLFAMPDLAADLLPYILHDVLLAELHGEAQVRQEISAVFKQALREVDDTTVPHVRLIINCILYLRNQPRPKESTIVQRDEWLDIDFAEASLAANKCCLPKTALILLETHTSRVAHGSRRSSVVRYEAPPEMLHEIFKNIDDPDFFYGVQQNASLSSVMETLERESSGFKNLLFQSAHYDSDIQMFGNGKALGVLGALNAVNLQGVANSMFSMAGGGSKDTSSSFDSMLKAATNLRQWDIPVSPLNLSPSATIFRVFQSLNTSSILEDAMTSIDESLLSILDLATSNSRSAMSLRTTMRVLGVMTEISDILRVRSAEEIESEWQKITVRNSWLKTTSVDEVGEILNSQEALFSSIKQRDYLKSAMNLSDRDAQLLEVKAIRQSLAITRDHGIAQASLKSAVCLSKLSEQCSESGINVDGAAKFDLANVLWDQGEMTPSIQMLRQLREQDDLHTQAVPISRAELLVTLGHHVAEARLEKPEAIVQEYLSQAVKELRNSSAGEEAGRVYHGFAMFCDQQLQNPDGLEDFKRVEQLRNRKEKEVRALEDMMKSADGKERDALRYHRTKTKQWFDLDDREYQRLLRSRESFLQQCLENYLLCLKESEAYNNDALRFCALWLDKSDSDIANQAVSKYLHEVPSRKFAPLMNQLSSRLLDTSDEFQTMLFALISRICVEHPFHGMYQIFASSKSKGSKDESALSRNRAAGRLVDGLKNDKRIGPTWVAVHNANINYVRFAIDRSIDKLKSGAKVPLKKLSAGQRLEQDAATQRLPPPTMHIDIRVDCDYSDIPKLVRYHPEFTIASGVSAPKIVSAWASNGQRYKQLFKGGNDDLRQDAIMEQVFEQVSSLLKDHQATRQRNLGIRTYKVLPLTSNAGIIEFVPHTIPLHDYLMPAHQRYYPKDMKPNVCRKHIADVQTRSFEQRVRTYRQVAEHFHPVMRYFFMENFNNPDDWFGRRLSYTRSTAAISILGHVLGLGDRHGHNILLDERTGEVVHIDLGVAFEQGRVLPVPEVVPFRLTRDLVDGMGITKTEGVFRRCCEFTLEALRQESYSIMTILDVLRYDPLYSWTVSPLRMKKMQDASEAGGGPPVLPGAVDKRQTNEPSEADRALTVVAKKLSKTLSVTATVNELIQQATDEKNLAVLYCGWAAYA